MSVVGDLVIKFSDLQRERQAEIDRLLSAALHDAGSSALGMPGTVETFNEWLKRHGLALVLDGAGR